MCFFLTVCCSDLSWTAATCGRGANAQHSTTGRAVRHNLTSSCPRPRWGESGLPLVTHMYVPIAGQTCVDIKDNVVDEGFYFTPKGDDRSREVRMTPGLGGWNWHQLRRECLQEECRPGSLYCHGQAYGLRHRPRHTASTPKARVTPAKPA